MRLDDHMMTVLTGLVFAIVMGTMAQKSDVITALFSDDEEYQIEDDVFFVRAGSDTTLDVLGNDYATTPITASDITIARAPNCGTVTATAEGVLFEDSVRCEGVVAFTYCVAGDSDCTPAQVVLNVKAAPLPVADAYLPPKGDLVPLPLSHVNKRAVQRDRYELDIEQPVEINAFAVTLLADQSSPFGSALPAAHEMAQFLIDTSALDLSAPPADGLDGSVFLHTINVPLSATRSARFLASHAADVAPADPARIYDNGVFGSSPALPTAGLEEALDFDLALPQAGDAEVMQAPAAELSLEDQAALEAGDPETAAPVVVADAPVSQTPLPAPLDSDVATVRLLPAGEAAPDADRTGETTLEVAAQDRAFEPALSGPAREQLQVDEIIATSAQNIAPVPVDTPDTQANACEAILSADAAPGAQIRLAISAPCHAGETVTARHQGIDFAVPLDRNGEALTWIPMLAVDPALTVTLGANPPEVLSVTSDDVIRVARSLIIKSADDGMRLAAVEFDQATGQDRLVTAVNSLPHREAYKLGRGYIRSMAGIDGKVIEIYTLPLSRRVSAGMVKLDLVAGLNATQCAQSADIQYLHLDGARSKLQTAQIPVTKCGTDLAVGKVIGNITVSAR